MRHVDINSLIVREVAYGKAILSEYVKWGKYDGYILTGALLCNRDFENHIDQVVTIGALGQIGNPQRYIDWKPWLY